MMNRISTNCAILEEVEKSCRYLIQNFEEESNNNIRKKCEPVCDKSQKKSAKTSTASGSQSSPAGPKKQSIENRLSMYSVPLKRTPKGSNIWKKNAAMLAKQRFNVQSRYKPGNYNPKAAEKPVLHFPVKTSVVQKRSSEMKTTPVHSCINDDDIPTMVQIGSKREMDDEKRSTFLSVTEAELKTRIEPMLQNLLVEMTTVKEEKIDHTNCDDILDKIKGILNQMQSLRVQGQTYESSENTHKKNSPEKNMNDIPPNPNVIITGSKNAKLICIKDKSCFENYKEDSIPNQPILVYANMDDKPVQLDTFEKIINDTELKKIENFNGSQNAKSAQSPIGQLPKKFAIHIVQYKLEFHKYSKMNHMYRKTSVIQPWELTSKISDQLLYKLLLSTIKEIELDQIIANVYQSEFD